MPTKTEVKGQWDQVKGQVRQRWAQITDNDFSRVKGNTEQLIGLIAEKTGTARREIESFLDHAMQNGESLAQNAAESVREYAHRATDAVKDGYDRVNEQVEAGFEDAQEMIRTHPGMSVGVAFGMGIVTGAVVGIMLTQRR